MGLLVCATSVMNVARVVRTPSSLSGVHGRSYLDSSLVAEVVDAIVDVLPPG